MDEINKIFGGSVSIVLKT
jgi:hypothetical protein